LTRIISDAPYGYLRQAHSSFRTRTILGFKEVFH
jgi:hypothetical protein